MDDFDDDGGTVFRDVTLVALSGFVAIVLVLLPFVNRPIEPDRDAKAADPGNVVIEMIWPADMNADVDLWVRAPGDLPVGYSNKGSAILNLLRDDLGHYNDLTDINYEVTYSRGIVAGEWIVNVHAFRTDADNPPPIPVSVVISVKKPTDDRPNQVYEKEVVLRRLGQELTAVRFTLTREGELVRGSINDLQYSLVLETHD